MTKLNTREDRKAYIQSITGTKTRQKMMLGEGKIYYRGSFRPIIGIFEESKGKKKLNPNYASENPRSRVHIWVKTPLKAPVVRLRMESYTIDLSLETAWEAFSFSFIKG